MQDDPLVAQMKADLANQGYKAPAQASAPNWQDQITSKYDTPTSDATSGSPVSTGDDLAARQSIVASVVGGKQLAQGLGQTIANSEGAQDASIQSQNQNRDIETQLIQKINSDRSAGKDVSKLEAALSALGTSQMNAGNETEDLGTQGLTDKGVIGSAIQLGANAIPTEALGGIAGNALKPVLGAASPLVGKGLAGAATGYAMDVGNQLQNPNKTTGEALIPGLGTAVGGAIPFAGALVGTLAKHIAGFNAGTGAAVIQQAVDNPDAVSQAVNKYATTPEAKQTLVDKAKAAISSFIQDKQNEYGNSLNQMGGRAVTLTPGEPTVIDSFEKNVAKFGGSISDDGELSFANSTLTQTDQNNLKQAFDTIQNWTDETPKGLDGLRQAIGNHMDEFSLSGNDRANVVLGAVQGDLKDMLSAKVPGYSDMLANYSAKSKVTQDIVKELQIGGTAKASTQLNNVMRIFQKDPALQTKLEKVMGQQGATDFLNEISGAILSDWLPQGKLMPFLKGAAEFGSLGQGLAGATTGLVGATTLGSMSPRIVGNASIAAGKLGQTVIPALASRAATMGASLTGQNN